MVKHVAEARETFGHSADGLLEPAHPVVSWAARKAARQKIGDCVKIGWSYRAGIESWPEAGRAPGSTGLAAFGSSLGTRLSRDV
jgi:hypothetical protein